MMEYLRFVPVDVLDVVMMSCAPAVIYIYIHSCAFHYHKIQNGMSSNHCDASPSLANWLKVDDLLILLATFLPTDKDVINGLFLINKSLAFGTTRYRPILKGGTTKTYAMRTWGYENATIEYKTGDWKRTVKKHNFRNFCNDSLLAISLVHRLIH